MNRIAYRFGTEIAPLHTYTDDFDWRYKIKENDLVDGLDAENTWYRSTCLRMVTKPDDTLPEEDEGQEPKMIKSMYIGYRIYDEDEGHKWDDDGKKFLGWSNKYDEWITVSSPTV